MTPPDARPAARPLPQTAAGFFLDPKRRAFACLGFGLAALLLAWLLSGANGIAAAFIAAWLCLLALPAGALPVVVMIERTDAWRPQPETALLETLRWLLALMPVAALLLVPILLLVPTLPSGMRGTSPFAALWSETPRLVLVLAACFAAWIGLVLLFARRLGAPAQAGWVGNLRAVLALVLHVVVGTLVADALVTAVGAPFPSWLSGLVLTAAWSALALSAAILVAPPDIGPARRRLDRLTPLAVLLAVWAVLHLAQFLVPWPADPAAEAAWYAQRAGPEGRALAVFSGFVVLLAALLTLNPGENRTRLVAGLSLVAHLAEMSWFVTPSLRGSFKVSLPDLLTLAGLAGLAVGLLPLAIRVLPALGPADRSERGGTG